MVKLVEWNARIDVSPDEARDVAREVEEWLLEYLGCVFCNGFPLNRRVYNVSSDRMKDYTETNMWDVWFTRSPQGISEVSVKHREILKNSEFSIISYSILRPDLQ